MKINLLGLYAILGLVLAAEAVNFIVQLSPKESISGFYARYQSFHEKFMSSATSDGSSNQFQIGDAFKGFAGSFDAGFLKSFFFDKNVLSITIDRTLYVSDVQEFAPKHLARISQREKLKSNQNLDFVYDPSAGNGVDVYILDTGIYNHPDLTGRVHKGSDFINDGNTGDPHGHGTAMAGLVGSETYGIAKKCNIIDYRVSDTKGRMKLSSVIKALGKIAVEAKVTGRPSLILLASNMPKNTVLNKAVEAIIALGIPVITGAGNQNAVACKSSPASASGALTVGAIDVKTDTLAPFSNYGNCVDLFAAGVDVITLDNSKSKSLVKSGTSMSAAITAGLVAYYMGMGDTGINAIKRVKNYTTVNAIPSKDLFFKPYTPNNVLYNCDGNPIW